MASAAPYVKLLRQLAAAKEDYLSGALDIHWESGSATLFTVFGRPAHAVLHSGGQELVGQDAVDALATVLPPEFEVSSWQRVMASDETLDCSIDDLTAPFVDLAGAAADRAHQEEHISGWLSGEDDAPALGFGLDDFPLLPQGEPLWTPAPAEQVRLAEMVPKLSLSLVTLEADGLRAAGIVVDGVLHDAVWVDGDEQARGDTAALAMLGAREGTVAAWRLAEPDLAGALSMLWRYPVAATMDAAWVDATALMQSLAADAADRALVVDSPQRGVALVARGALVAVYSEDAPVPSAEPARLHALLAGSTGHIRVLQRPGTVAATRMPAPTVVEPPASPDSGTVIAPAPTANGVAVASATIIGVDIAEVKRELAAIGVEWLGDNAAGPVTAIISATPASLDDVVAMIDSIRRLAIPGQDAASVQAMARAMHVHAAERLCGA